VQSVVWREKRVVTFERERDVALTILSATQHLSSLKILFNMYSATWCVLLTDVKIDWKDERDKRKKAKNVSLQPAFH
jgi:hypothetical protein